jgi:uncharacterized protein YecT (DUF1311 family)
MVRVAHATNLRHSRAHPPRVEQRARAAHRSDAVILKRNWLGRRTIGSLTAYTMDKHCALFGLAVGVALLAAGSAHADHTLECDKVQLPSSLVICSDPDLLAIADERGQVYQELWARLDTAQRAALQADQAQWVREYATRCGLPPDLPPRLPPTLSVLDCFKQAGRARIAFLRGYPSTGAGAAVHPNPAHDRRLAAEL